MDIDPEELQFLTIPQVIVESISFAKRSPKMFYFITLTLIFPLSFAILAHSLFTYPILEKLRSVDSYDSTQARRDWAVLLIFQFSYLLFLFVFSLLSTAAVVFTVASLYTAKPVSFSSTISAIPKVFKRLFITFLWISLLMLAYHTVLVFFLSLLYAALDMDKTGLALLAGFVISILYFGVHVYITALWHLASVISVLEPIYGYAAMKKSYELLKGRTRMVMVLVFGYLSLCTSLSVVFVAVVVHGGEETGMWTRIMAGGILVGVLVTVNLMGLLVQSVIYYVCKSYHRETIDKTALHDHLGGYLGEYVPLKSNIQMENLNA